MRYCFLFLAVCLLSACAAPDKMLNRTWKIDDVQFLDSLNTFTTAQKEMLTKGLKTNLNFTFLPDSNYQVNSSGELHKSKWWLTRNKKDLFLYTIDPEGKVIKSRIVSLKKNYLQFEAASNDNQGFKFTCSPVINAK